MSKKNGFSAVKAVIGQLEERIAKMSEGPGLECVGIDEVQRGNRDEAWCRLIEFTRGDDSYRVRVAMEGMLAAHLDKTDPEATRKIVEDYYLTRVGGEILWGELPPGSTGVFLYLDGKALRDNELNIHCPEGKFPPDGDR